MVGSLIAQTGARRPSAETYVVSANPRTRNGGWPESRVHRAWRGPSGIGYQTACGKLMVHVDLYATDRRPANGCRVCFHEVVPGTSSGRAEPTPRWRLPRLIADPVLVRLASELMAAEQAACPTCRRNDVPAHFHSYPAEDGLRQHPCESYNRVFDPATGQFVGNAHCSCDSCF
jgi:hypothetical protein